MKIRFVGVQKSGYEKTLTINSLISIFVGGVIIIFLPFGFWRLLLIVSLIFGSLIIFSDDNFESTRYWSWMLSYKRHDSDFRDYRYKGRRILKDLPGFKTLHEEHRRESGNRRSR